MAWVLVTLASFCRRCKGDCDTAHGEPVLRGSLIPPVWIRHPSRPLRCEDSQRLGDLSHGGDGSTGPGVEMPAGNTNQRLVFSTCRQVKSFMKTKLCMKTTTPTVRRCDIVKSISLTRPCKGCSRS